MEEAPGLLSDQSETVRAFVAVGIPDLQRERLAPYLAACVAVAPDFRWVTPDSLHFTLRFLGAVDRRRLDELASRLRSLTLEPFSVAFGRAGSFGRGSAVRVIWLGLGAGSDELGRLAAEIEARCAAEGFEPEARGYSPHLTLARSRQRRGDRLPELPTPPEIPGWTVTAYRLYRSRPGPRGATYSVLEEFGA